MRAFLMLVIYCGIATGCGEGLPRYREVEDLRVLAIRADPPELLVNTPPPPFRAPLAESLEMSFEALVVDPRGGEIQLSWSFCPIESARACRDYESKRDTAIANMTDLNFADKEARRSAIDSMRNGVAYQLSESALTVPESTIIPPLFEFTERAVWHYDTTAFSITPTEELAYYHRDATLFGMGMGAWPSAILEVVKGEEELLAMKRVVLNLEDLGPLAGALAAQFGYELCPPGKTPQDLPGCILIEKRIANSNPVFELIEVSDGETAFASFHQLTFNSVDRVAGYIFVQTGESVRIRPTFTAASSEPYQTIRADLETRTLFVEDHVEQVSVSWFVSHGEIQDQITWPVFTKTLDTVYEAPNTVPEDNGGRATIWLVARDQRGGVAWVSVEVVVRP